MEKRTFNLHVTVNHVQHYFGNVSENMLLEHLKTWLNNSVAEDSFALFSHEVEFDDDGIPFEDENGEVIDDI